MRRNPDPNRSADRPSSTPRWTSIREAALILGFGTVSLRRLIERHSRRAADGGIEAVVDGLRARKIGRTWRVQLSTAWSSEPASPRGDRSAT